MASPGDMFTGFVNFSLNELQNLCKESGLSESGDRLSLVVKLNHLKSESKAVAIVSSTVSKQISDYKDEIADLEHQIQSAGFSEFLCSNLESSNRLRHSTRSSEQTASGNKIVARTNGPLVTQRSKKVGYDVHYSSSLLPPPTFSDDKPFCFSVDNSIFRINEPSIHCNNEVDNSTLLDIPMIPPPPAFQSSLPIANMRSYLPICSNNSRRATFRQPHVYNGSKLNSLPTTSHSITADNVQNPVCHSPLLNSLLDSYPNDNLSLSSAPSQTNRSDPIYAIDTNQN